MRIEETTKNNRIPKLLIIICILFWFVGFTYNTGFGETYNVFEKTRAIVIVVFLAFLIIRSNSYHIGPGIVLAVAIVLFIAFVNKARNGNSVFDYIWVWLIIPVIGLFTVEESQMRRIGFLYGIASTGVLLIGNVTDVFKYWDGNSVSMVQFFSYTVFMSIFSDIRDAKNIRNIIVFSAVYFYFLNIFDSRSAILFSVVMLLCILSVIPLRKCLSKLLIFLILLFPLIIAVIVIGINETIFAENLNSWSIEIFDKPIFNGRDIIWEGGIKDWLESPFIGNGNFAQRAYHNSAICTLVAVGGIGYIILIGAACGVLVKGLKWRKDSIVYGLTTSFLVIWMQQSVELGLIASKPNVIPYLILGLLYARVNTLEGRIEDANLDNNTDIQHGKISS